MIVVYLFPNSFLIIEFLCFEIFMHYLLSNSFTATLRGIELIVIDDVYHSNRRFSNSGWIIIVNRFTIYGTNYHLPFP